MTQDVQLDDDPVALARSKPAATPPRLPSISHILPAARQDQVPTASKVLVTLASDGTAVQNVSEVDGFAVRVSGSGRRDDTTVRAETAETTIGVHRQLEVRDGLGSRGEEEEVALSGSERCDCEQRLPLYDDVG